MKTTLDNLLFRLFFSESIHGVERVREAIPLLWAQFLSKSALMVPKNVLKENRLIRSYLTSVRFNPMTQLEKIIFKQSNQIVAFAT